MPVLDPSEWELESGQEPYVMPDGTEAKLRIVDVRLRTDRNGLSYIQPVLEVVDEPYSKDFTHFLHIPDKEKMTQKRLNQARNAMSDFLKAFEIDISGAFDPKDDWPGHEGWAILGVRTDEQYGDQNQIRKLILVP